MKDQESTSNLTLFDNELISILVKHTPFKDDAITDIYVAVGKSVDMTRKVVAEIITGETTTDYIMDTESAILKVLSKEPKKEVFNLWKVENSMGGKYHVAVATGASLSKALDMDMDPDENNITGPIKVRLIERGVEVVFPS